MRTILAAILLAAATAASAQTILKNEPLSLAPGQVAYVATGCMAGMVMKITGAYRGLNRKRACVTLDEKQALLAE